MGPVGSASLIKVITNMLALVHLQVCGEALMLASRGGLDLATSWRAIAASSGNSFVHETEGQLILNGSYDIGFTIDLALKDLGLRSNSQKSWACPSSWPPQRLRAFRRHGPRRRGEQSPKLLNYSKMRSTRRCVLRASRRP